MAYHESGDRTLRDALVAEHLPLARRLARRFTNRGIPFEDLFQVASVGLVHAVDRFDPYKGSAFTTFATPTILGEIKRHFRDRAWDVRVPRRLQELHVELNGTISSLAGRPDLFVGGETPSTGIVVDQNFLYRSDNGLTLRLGYAGVSEGTLTYTGNQVVGSTDIQSWSSISQSGNSVLSLTSKPSDTKVFVRPNRYEQGRANVIVYNWSHAGSVSADLSGVLDAGDRYEIRNAQNFYGAPVASGTYAGGSIALPMGAVTPPMPIGRGGSPGTTGTVFHVFVILPLP